MKTVTYHCDYCNNLIPEKGEMIQLQSDSGINVSNTFTLSKECKLNNWRDPDDTAEKYYNNPEKSATEKPSEEFISYLFFINNSGNRINAIKKSDFKNYSKTIKWENGYSLNLINNELSKPNQVKYSKKYLLEDNKYATINEAAELISLMEKNKPGLKVHFANPKL